LTLATVKNPVNQRLAQANDLWGHGTGW